MAAETREAPAERRTLGDDLAHFCRVHCESMYRAELGLPS